ncbi:MAG: sugar phosphate isomerase/epimerase family protein [bacterium]
MAISSQITRRGFLDKTLKIGTAGLLMTEFASSRTEAAPDTPKSSAWQIGCYTRPWDKYEYRVALDAITEAGFKHAGLMTTNSETHLVISPSTALEEAQKIGEEVKQRGLEVPSVYGGGIPVNESLKAGIDALRKLLDNCAAVQAKTLLMAGVTEPELYEPYYKAIAECCDYAAEKGIELTLKPHGGSNATGSECCKAIKTVAHKNFTFWYDPGNIYYYSDGKLDPVNDSTTLDVPVTGICVKDYLDHKNVMVTPGTGKVNFPAVLAHLREHGLTQGPLVIETLSPGDLKETLEQAKKAREFMEELVS